MILRDLIKAKLVIGVVALVAINISQQNQIDQLKAAMEGPGSWQKGISQIYESTEWGSPNKQNVEHLVSLRANGCELHRINWRGVYYLLNTCGGIAPEFQGLNAPALSIPTQTGTVVPENKFGSEL